MSMERGARRLRAALRAYPRDTRQAEGDLIISLAGDMVDGGQSSINREALGMLRGGLAARAGDLANAPWEEALRRVSLPIAAALLAFNIGALAFWLGMDGLVWPGWSWIAALGAPGLAVFGLLAGRRMPLALGAALICLLGFAQGNGPFLAGRLLNGNLYWATGGFDIPILACAIPAGMLLLATALCAGRRAARLATLTTLTWVVAGAIAVRLIYVQQLTVGGVALNGTGICVVAYGIVMVAALAVGLVRCRRDPAGMLAGLLGLATILPVLLLYGVSSIPLDEDLLRPLLVLSVLGTTALLVRIVRFTPTLKR